MQDWQDLLKTMAAAASQVGNAAKSVEKSLKKNGAADEETKGHDGKKVLKTVVTAAGVTAAAVGIGYALYRYFAPNYLSNFPDDDFKDDFDDYFEDEDEGDSRTEKSSGTEEAGAKAPEGSGAETSEEKEAEAPEENGSEVPEETAAEAPEAEASDEQEQG